MNEATVDLVTALIEKGAPNLIEFDISFNHLGPLAMAKIIKSLELN